MRLRKKFEKSDPKGFFRYFYEQMQTIKFHSEGRFLTLELTFIDDENVILYQ